MWTFLSPMLTVFNLKRTCPRCGHSQIVPKDKQDQTVTCKYCGAPIPPETEHKH